MTLPTEAAFGGAAPLRGRLRLPGDKSLSHRAYLFASLATGRSILTNLATGEDVHATRLALEHLGVRVHTAPGGRVSVRAAGIGGWREPDVVLDCGNSGTTMRLLAGALAGRPFLAVLSGDASLRRRPMGRVREPLVAMGAAFDGREHGRFPPITVRGGPLVPIRYELPVASAQVKSALVLAGLQTEGLTELVEPVRSRDHTERMLAALGAPVEAAGTTTRVVGPGAPEPFELEVPGDPSSAAFFAVAATITPGSDVLLEDVALNPTRTRFVDVLRRMGADIDLEPAGERLGEPVGAIRVRHAPLGATRIDGDEIPAVIDEIPVLAMAAAFADGVTEIRDAAELRVKETDRVGTVSQELEQLGVAVETHPDGLTIRGGRPRPGHLKSHGDHRVGMAAAVAAHALDGETVVRGWRAVGSSYPEFADHLAALGQGRARP